MQLIEELRRRACPLPGPGGEAVPTVSPADLAEVGQAFGLPLRQAELVALRGRVLPERYLRNLGTVGWGGQCRLLESCVAVVGCGGLGGNVIEGLARSGVGRLVLVDGDSFAAHNLNRQLLSTVSDLGRPKAEVAQERVRQVNPAVETTAHAVLATAENLPMLLAEVEVVVDALDNVGTRLELQAVARQQGIPLVHGAIAGFVGQVTTVLPGDDTLNLLYGQGEVPEHGVETLLGTPAATPMLVAACQVTEVFKLLLDWGELLRGRMLYIDLEVGTIEQFPLFDVER